nr:BrnT family toxin [Endozoicomonas sp.]
MNNITFEWHVEKSGKNLKKHSISFEEAKSVFLDQNALLINDPDHSEEEDRFIILGLSASLNLLVVCHCYRSEPETIRIISARRASKKESMAYKGK